METLITYLRETRTTPKAFAKLIGVDADRLERMLTGAELVEAGIAQRMVDATGGALILADLTADEAREDVIVDLRSRFASDDEEIDVARLEAILKASLVSLLGGGRRRGDDHLPGLAAEAAAHTYVALSTVTTRRGADRLAQALRPVFAEILADFEAPVSLTARLEKEARRAAETYFQAPPEKRRA
jgi:DNA-binding transcriptional regulator YdaS (Cro superfamily)